MIFIRIYYVCGHHCLFKFSNESVHGYVSQSKRRWEIKSLKRHLSALESVKSSEGIRFFRRVKFKLNSYVIENNSNLLWWLPNDLSRYCIEEKIWREHAPLLNMSSVVSNSSQPRHETKVMDDLVWMILFPKFDYPKKSRIIFLQSIGWVDLSYTFLLVRSIWSHSRLQKKIRITRKDSIEAALKLFW